MFYQYGVSPNSRDRLAVRSDSSATLLRECGLNLIVRGDLYSFRIEGMAGRGIPLRTPIICKKRIIPGVKILQMGIGKAPSIGAADKDPQLKKMFYQLLRNGKNPFFYIHKNRSNGHSKCYLHNLSFL